MKHSKLPWRVNNMGHTIYIVDANEANLVELCSAGRAELIARAVNNHERLLEACKLGLDMYELHTGNHPDDALANSHKDRIREAIKQAEGE